VKITEILEATMGRGWTPKRKLARYNPDGKVYTGGDEDGMRSMPTLDPNDPVHNAEPHDPDDINQSYTQDYEQDLDRENLKNQIQQSLISLTPREQAILKLRFWKDMTYTDVGRILGYSSTRIQQIEAQALRKLRHPSRSDRLKPYIEK